MVVSTLVPKTSSLQPLSADFEFAAAVMRLKQLCSNTFKCLDLSPCCSTAILPTVVTELTEYKCQSVFRSCHIVYKTMNHI